jgi:hypothetical protein
MPWYMRQHDARMASPGMPVTSAQPGRVHPDHNAARGRYRIRHLPHLKRLPNAIHHHSPHLGRPFAGTRDLASGTYTLSFSPLCSERLAVMIA